MVRKFVMAMNWDEAFKKAKKKYPNDHIVSVRPEARKPRKYFIITKRRKK